MFGLVHAFRDASLGAATGTIIFDTVCYVDKMVHALKGLVAVAEALMFHTVLYE